MKIKSLKRLFINIFILILVSMLAGLLVSVIGHRALERDYQYYFENSANISTLPLIINRNIKNLEEYIRTGNPEFLQKYNSSSFLIYSILEQIKEDADTNSSIHIRVISNINTYQMELTEQIFSESTGVQLFNILSKVRALLAEMNTHSQMLIISYLNYSKIRYIEILTNNRTFLSYMYLMIGVITLTSIMTSYLILRNAFKVVNNISTAAVELSNTNWEIADISKSDYKELNSVANAFNQMKNSIRLYIEDLNNKADLENQLFKQKVLTLEKDKLLKESQFINLQSQIKPHFLFNTLNMISRTAMLNDNKTTVRLIESVSNLFRYNIDNNVTMVPLIKELETLKNYIYIQKMRFQDRLEIVVKDTNVPYDVYVPPLILQPILENAIIHGLYDLEIPGRISIEVQAEEEYVIIEIADKGKGIEPEKLSKLFENNKEEKEQQSGLGLMNIKNRLELFYKQENLIEIESHLGQGTLVRLRIPTNREQDND